MRIRPGESRVYRFVAGFHRPTQGLRADHMLGLKAKGVKPWKRNRMF